MGSNRYDDKDNMGNGRPVMWYVGEGAGGPRGRWRKENGERCGNERGLTAEGGGRRRKYFSTSAGGKGRH